MSIGRVFIRKKNNEFETYNFYQAYEGFNKLGFEVHFFEGELPEYLTRYDVVFDYISGVKKAISNLGITPPTEIDYPEELQKYYGRKLWKSDIDYISSHPELFPVFVKPVLGKQFDGRLVKNFGDLIGCGKQGYSPEVWCSEPVSFVTEWRVFVRYGKVIDARPYKGSPFSKLDEETVMNCIKDFEAIPAGCSLDFGITPDGKCLLIEVNDGYSLGNYGLLGVFYAKLIYARWCEMVGIPDELQYF